MSMYIESVLNRNPPPRSCFASRTETTARCASAPWPTWFCLSADVIEGLKVLLRGGVAVPSAESVFSVERSLPHGAITAAVLGAARGSGSSVGSAAAPQDLQPVLQAMLVGVCSSRPQLATHRMLQEDTATSSLGAGAGGVGQCSADDLYRALDWLHDAGRDIERGWRARHPRGSTLCCTDPPSTWLTGRCCELAARGHSRDGSATIHRSSSGW
ncbi:MAG: hypothetical protein IPI02_20235 [Sterolibacteriaceae bacterium]|nr:hypothetical protein [Sterolibacteriaceae bacterium]